MKSIEIIVAHDSDTLARCLRIREAVFIVEKGVPKEIETDSLDCLDGACSHVLVCCDGEDVGALRCAYTAEGIVRIQRFCVLQAYRGSGIGKHALEQVESHCRRGCRAVELDAKLAAAGFYEACGYKTVSAPFVEAGVPHVKMAKDL